MNPFPSNKRQRPESPRAIQIPPHTLHHSTTEPVLSSAPSGSSSAHGSAASSFRNVSACDRCRTRKNRCDQNLPACSSCEKARVKCVGYDPITKRKIPRAYVYYLESRITYLEETLSSRGIAFAPADDFGVGTKPLADSVGANSPSSERRGLLGAKSNAKTDVDGRKQEEAEKLNKLVSNIGMVSVQGASDPRYLGSTSGISFARVVFAAVRSSVSGSTSERAGPRPGKALGAAAAANGTSMRDSFFGLQSKPNFRQAPFPDRELGARLVDLYFENANCQIPILHRGEFMSLFDRAYASDDRRRSPRELYMLNIVFAIGAGIIFGAPATVPPATGRDGKVIMEPVSPKTKRQKVASHQCQPEEYHASAMVHLEYFLGSTPAAERPEGFGGSLEELQAVLLLAGFALLRPVAPGLWYIVGVAVRLAVDLGLHYEDGTGVEDSMGGTGVAQSHEVALEAAGVRVTGIDPKEKGRREWVRDLRRRLWWCVYSFDRLVSTCVGRPFGITDQVITTEFPSILDDNYITTSGINAPPGKERDPSYKRVAHHYFRLRLLQSEILQVLQHRQARQARDKGRNSGNEFMHTKLASPFLEGFESFHNWRKDIDRRLWEWKESAPQQKDTTVSFSVQFLELNYWQAVIMLYRQSLTVPPELGNEVSPSSEIASPMELHAEEENDDDVFLKVAEAGQNTLKLYYTLHRAHVVNYTFLATHHLFMAGIAFLYAIWHSNTVRKALTLDDVDYTILAATTVLGNLMDKCPPAEACKDAFDRMAKATISMCMSDTGFGTRAPLLGVPKPTRNHSPAPHSRSSSSQSVPTVNQLQQQQQPQQQSFFQTQNEYGQFRPQRPRPQFDMNLRDLFPEDTRELQNFRSVAWGALQPQAQQHMPPPQAPNAMQYQPLLRASTSPVVKYDAPAAQYGTPITLQQVVDTNVGAPSYGNFPTVNHAPVDVFLKPEYDNYGYRNDLDALLADSTAAYNGQAGLSLGFDTEHDWNDGYGPDMFDSFWFGGWNGSAGGAAAGAPENGDIGDDEMRGLQQ